MRIVVLGSKTWVDEEKLRDRLIRVISTRQRRHGKEHPKDIIIVHTQSPYGVDGLVRKFCDEHGYTSERYSSDWYAHPQNAGEVRVQRMYDTKPDEVVVFISLCKRKQCEQKRQHGTHGVLRLRELARERGLKVRSFYEKSW
jgi:hypothetical protein